MPSKAYLLIRTDTGKVNEVVNSLKQLEGVKAVDPVSSKYDVIAILEEDSITNLSRLLTSKIKNIPHICKLDSCFRLAGLT